jgi:pilus assembly protein FimV
MTVRFDSVPVAMKRRAAQAAVAAAFIALSGVASAQGGKAAASSAPAEAPVFKIIGHYGVKPGQSLHDIAAELAQSNDRHVIATVSRALFEANPTAFAKQDPSRLKIGATLKVPEVPGLVEGASQAAAPAPAPVPAPAPAAVQGHAPAALAAASAAKVPAPAAPVAPVAPIAPAKPAAQGASAVVAASPAVVAPATASAVAPSSAPSAASGPSVAAGAIAVASAPAAVSGASAPAVGAVGASAPATALAASGASAGVAASVPAAATSASDTHVWSGSIQAAPAGAAASGAASAQGAPAANAPVTVSSLQQLLALKNRVLMALQQHGIGQSQQTAGSGRPASAPGAKVPEGGAGSRVTGSLLELPPLVIGIVAAGVVVLLVLFLGWLTIGRKKPADKAAEAAPEQVEPPVLDTPPRAGEPSATAAPATPAVTPGPAQRDEVLNQATRTAGLSAAASLGGEALPSAQFDAEPDEVPQNSPAARYVRAEHGITARGVERGEPETLADASEAASFAAAAELGASALPLEPVEAPRTAGEVEKLARDAEPEQGPDWLEAEAGRQADTPVHAEAESAPEPELDPEPEHTARHVATEPEALAPQQVAEPQPARFEEPAFPAVPAEEAKAAEAPGEFPADAVSALGGIDMTLPPRVAEPVAQRAPLSTQPVASPETTAAQAVPLYEPAAPRVAESITAGTAGPGATAGLGAPRFGALTLDFDLNLPPDSAEPLPVFTPEQLARIARNKLELAHEYIALGDLGGARALINEVIDSNDHATRTDAQALLSTLAPLS